MLGGLAGAENFTQMMSGAMAATKLTCSMLSSAMQIVSGAGGFLQLGRLVKLQTQT